MPKEPPKRATSAKGSKRKPNGRSRQTAEGLEPASDAVEPEILSAETTSPESPSPESADALEAELLAGPASEALARTSPTGPLAPRDALRSYMAEVSRHPVLSREDQ